jgi:predicted dehydrogenase
MPPPNVLIIGSGEYVSGIVSSDGAASSSDKSKGVVALVMFDLRARKKIGPRIAIAGTCGLKFPHIRQHFAASIAAAYRDMDVSFESFPADNVERKPDAYMDAISSFAPGDLAVIFTPDDTHFDICKACLHHGLHVCVTKPLVQSLPQHRELAALALQQRVLSYVEVHKRWDPIYIDARARLRKFGDFSFFQAFMSQPKKQLKTFAGWAGISSDISFYLNSHHVDYHCWCMQGIARPVTVSASASTGVAAAALGRDCADSITLMVQWRSEASGNLGVATYTASWTASPSDVHRLACLPAHLLQISSFAQPAALLLQRPPRRYHRRPGAQGIFGCGRGLPVRFLQPPVLQVHPRRQRPLRRQALLWLRHLREVRRCRVRCEGRPLQPFGLFRSIAYVRRHRDGDRHSRSWAVESIARRRSGQH